MDSNVVTTDTFLQTEKNYGLFENRIDGVPYWGFYRGVIWNFHILGPRLALDYQMREKAKDPDSRIVKIAKSLFHATIAYRGKLKKDVDVCFIGSGRKVKKGDYYYCPYTDNIKEVFDHSSITLELPHLRQHYKPSKNNDVYYLDYITSIVAIYSFINKRLNKSYYKRIQELIYEQTAPAFMALAKGYQVELDITRLVESLSVIVVQNKMRFKLYKKLFKKMKPKLIVEGDNSGNNMAITEVARSMNIPTVLLQYCPFTKYTLAYQYATEREISWFPDKIFLYSDFWRNTIKLPIPDANIVSVGCPYFEESVRKYKAHSRNCNKKTLLFLSQDAIGYEFSKFAVEVWRRLPQEEYHIIFKFHPREYSIGVEQYTWLSETSIEVVDSPEKNLYECFAQSDIQIGVYSTAVFEGLGFDLVTYLYKIGKSDAVEDLVQYGYANWVHDSEELCQYIQAADKTDKNMSGMFWEKDSLNNMKREIEKILAEEHVKKIQEVKGE
ncbi:MAG: hypothetical protein FWE25_00750 [Lachnospiraceae bacterium]|nr:hypothetical protein [Lachnospiraceae bacterium]